MGPPGDKPPFFSATEWAAAFPSPPPPEAEPLDGGPAPRDFAEALRTDLTLDDVARSLGDFPLLRGQIRVRQKFLWMIPLQPLRHFVFAALVTGCLATSVGAEGAASGQKELIGGFIVATLASFGFFFVSVSVVTILQKGFPEQLAGNPIVATGKIVLGVLTDPVSWNAVLPPSKVALNVAPLSLAACRAAPVPHAAGAAVFSSCCCPDCIAELLRKTGIQWLLDNAVRCTVGCAMVVMFLWTPSVSVGTVWQSWWGMLLFALMVAAGVLVCFEAFVFLPSDLVLSRISGRFQLYLLRRSLSALLLRAKDAVQRDAPFVGPGELWDSAVEPYMDLHASMAACWRKALLSTAFFPWQLPFLILLYLLAMVVNLAIGACLPAYAITGTCYCFSMLLLDLWTFAAVNAEVTAAASLHLSAVSTLQRLAIAASPPDRPASPLAAHLLAHERAIAGCAEEGLRSRVRFLGLFVVDYGSMRGLLITVATVGFAFAGFLRGFGVTVTMDAFC